MEFLKVFDAYSLRARLFPAVIAAVPAFAATALLVSWRSVDISTIFVSVAVLVLFFAMSDLARSRGRRIEGKLYLMNGGSPSIGLFRRADPTLNEAIKKRYREFLSKKLGVDVPSAELELADQRTADSFYEQCSVWLRANTRDTRKFPILFAENITYGFRRNLLGVKWFALGLNVSVVVACALLLIHANWDWASVSGERAVVVLVLAAFHAGFMLLVVSKEYVWDAARAYGRELILSCETLMANG